MASWFFDLSSPLPLLPPATSPLLSALFSPVSFELPLPAAVLAPPELPLPLSPLLSLFLAPLPSPLPSPPPPISVSVLAGGLSLSWTTAAFDLLSPLLVWWLSAASAGDVRASMRTTPATKTQDLTATRCPSGGLTVRKSPMLSMNTPALDYGDCLPPSWTRAPEIYPRICRGTPRSAFPIWAIPTNDNAASDPSNHGGGHQRGLRHHVRGGIAGVHGLAGGQGPPAFFTFGSARLLDPFRDHDQPGRARPQAEDGRQGSVRGPRLGAVAKAPRTARRRPSLRPHRGRRLPAHLPGVAARLLVLPVRPGHAESACGQRSGHDGRRVARHGGGVSAGICGCRPAGGRAGPLPARGRGHPPVHDRHRRGTDNDVREGAAGRSGFAHAPDRVRPLAGGDEVRGPPLSAPTIGIRRRPRAAARGVDPGQAGGRKPPQHRVRSGRLRGRRSRCGHPRVGNSD